MSRSLSGIELKRRWKLGSKIGSGGCAEVYQVTDLRGAGGEELVAKVAPLPEGLPPAMSKGKKRKKTDKEKHADMLYYEYTLYNGYLRAHKGVPKVPHGGYGDDQSLRFLIMTRLGPDVEAARTKSGPWPIVRLAAYARQMLTLLRFLHEHCKMVFVDVKPENFMFGLPGSGDEDKIFLIDFGLSERYTGAGGSIKPQKTSSQVAGTPEFLSLRCHAGAGAGRCDDLESLGYVIISLIRGGSSPLPWSGAKSVADGLKTKRATSLEDLCREVPAPMLRYLKLVRDMAYEDTPDYDALDSMLKDMELSDGEVRERSTAGKRAGKEPRSAKVDSDKMSARDGADQTGQGELNMESSATGAASSGQSRGNRKGKAPARTNSSEESPHESSAGTAPSTRAQRRRGLEARQEARPKLERAVGGRRANASKPEVVEDSDRHGGAREHEEEEDDNDEGLHGGDERRASMRETRSGARRRASGGASSAASGATGGGCSGSGTSSQAGARRKQGLTPPTKLPASLTSLLGQGDVADGKRRGGSTPRRGQGAGAVAKSELANGNSTIGAKKRSSAPKKRARDDDGRDEEAEVEGDEEDSSAFFDAQEGDDEEQEPLADDKRVARVFGRGGDGRDGDSKARRSPRNAQQGREKTTTTAGKAQKKGRSSSAESPLRFRLEVLTGPHKGDSLVMPDVGTDVRVGRGAPKQKGLRLDRDLEVSHRHSILRASTDGVLCEDVGSLNGTFVNEDRLDGPSKLVAGDVLQFGQSAVRVCAV